ncbi:TPA: hypothetical protein ACGCZH_001776, partial [Acinetobacter baumannii]
LKNKHSSTRVNLKFYVEKFKYIKALSTFIESLFLLSQWPIPENKNIIFSGLRNAAENFYLK